MDALDMMEDEITVELYAYSDDVDSEETRQSIDKVTLGNFLKAEKIKPKDIKIQHSTDNGEVRWECEFEGDSMYRDVLKTTVVLKVKRPFDVDKKEIRGFYKKVS